MRGEIYVLSLLRVSELADNVVTEHLRDSVNSNAVAELTDPERQHLAGARYEYLADKITEAFQPPPPPRFTEANFLDLLQPAVQRELARVLGCPPEDALASLLDPIPIMRDLDSIQPSTLPPTLDADVEPLLYALLTGPANGHAVTRIRQRYQFGENDWGTYLRTRRWLLDSAIDLLHQEATRRGWGRVEPSRALAGLIAHAGQPTAERLGPSEGHFDALAIVVLRRLAAQLAGDLREEAEASISSAIAKAPTMTGLIKLRGWIDLYERNSLARGLLKLCGGTVPLRRVIAHAERSVKQVYATYEKPIRNENLTVGNVNEFPRREGLLRREQWYVTFDVQCLLGDDDEPVTILTITRLPRRDFPQVRGAIERLHGTDLSAVGDTVGDRLLNTGVSAGNDLQSLLRGYIERHCALVAQTIVLAGIQQPLTADDVPWQRSLRDHLRYIPRNPDQDVVFQKDLAEIIDEVREHYRDTGRDLVIDSEPP